MAQGFSERVRWSRETWSLNELVLRFGNQFPVIVNTTTGFYGANEIEVISAGEILRIHSLVIQRRIFARDVRGRIFSLPLNLTVKFETLKENGRKTRPKRLSEILDDCELPTRVAFAADNGGESFSFSVGEMRYDSGKLGTLTLYKVYEETFLRVNSIARGAMDKTVMLLPLYVQIQVSVAKGFKDGHTDDWDSLMQMYDRSIGQSKMVAINGHDEILVYDPTDGIIVNPQANANDMFSLQDARSTSMLVKGFESGKGHDSLIGRLSTFKIGGNKDGDRMAKSFTEYRDNTVNILRSGGNRTGGNVATINLQEDEYVFSEPEARSQNRKRTQNRSNHTKKSRSSKISFPSPENEESHVEHESNEMTVFTKEDQEREMNIQVNIETRDRKATDIATDEIRMEENHSDLQSSRPKPLERPILAKRTSAPTGKVSPMIKASPTIAAIVLSTDAEADQVDGWANGETVPTSGGSPLQQEERQPKAVIISSIEVTEKQQQQQQVNQFSDSEVIHKLDDGQRPIPRPRLSQSTEEFSDATVNRPSSRSKKKSALKAGRKRSTRTKRHVSYSDTDTVYPLDSHDDDMMAADDSELDSPFYSNAASTTTVFADNWRSRSMIVAQSSRHSHTLLPVNSRRQNGSSVVNVLPVTSSSFRKKNSLPMTRKHFHGSDTNVFSKSSSASFRYPSIPEALEEYQTAPVGTTIRQYDTAGGSRVRAGDLDTHRKYGSSVISVGNVRSEGGLMSRRQNMEPAIISVGDNSFLPMQNNDVLPRRRTDSRAATSNRKPVFDWKQDAISSGRRHDHKMSPTMSSSQKRNGATAVLPLTDYAQPLYNFTTHPNRTLENRRSFAGKVIRLNETRDGNMWDEISDYEVDKSDPLYSRRGTTSARHAPDANYLIHSASMSRVRGDGSNGGMDVFSPPAMGNSKNHLTHLSPSSGLVSTVAVHSFDRGRSGVHGRSMSTYGETRETFSTGTMPKIYRDNQNVARKIGVVAPNVVLVRK